MRAKLIRIGNSRGIRLTKAWLDQCGFGDEVDVAIQEGRLVISPVAHPRQGWDEAFTQMSKVGDDRLLDADQKPVEWDQTEWEW